MSRWQPNAHGRLAEAALELYAERGYDQVTVAEIAERAGLTERTYFRYFPDKREVLFGGQADLTEVLIGRIDAAPEHTPPLDTVGLALAAFGEVLDGRRDQARKRQSVIDANPSLQERELTKLALLTREIADALCRRGVDEPTARLAAETGMAVFKVAFERWVRGDSGQGLAAIVEAVRRELADLV